MHSVVFPCERVPYGWRNVTTGVLVDLIPTRRRNWAEQDGVTYLAGRSCAVGCVAKPRRFLVEQLQKHLLSSGGLSSFYIHYEAWYRDL